MKYKNKRFYFVVTTIAICCGMSCKKAATIAPAARYHITHVVDSATYANMNTYPYTMPYFQQVNMYDITYNRNSPMQITDDVVYNTGPFVGNDVATFTYFDSSYTIYHSNYYNAHDSVVANGLDEILFIQGIHSANFEYDQFFRVINSYTSTMYVSTVYGYTWNKDNNIVTAFGGMDTLHFDYYTDKPNTAADIFEINYLLTYGTQIIRTKNLTKSISSTSSKTNADYTFDANNRVVSARSTQIDINTYTGNDTITHSYTYTYSPY